MAVVIAAHRGKHNKKEFSMGLVLILVALIAFIVLATSRLKLHPFLALLAAALLAGFAYQVPTMEIVKTITGGFGAAARQSPWRRR